MKQPAKADRHGRRMSRATVIPILVLLFIPLAGCEQSSKIKESVAPPPPRRALAPPAGKDPETFTGATTGSEPAVQAASHTPGKHDIQTRGAAPSLTSDLLKANPNTLLLARAAGKPIFLRDVLDAVGSQLAADQARLAADDFLAVRHERIAEGLRTIVERELILQEAARELKEPQLKLLRNEAEKEFKKRVRTLMQQMDVSTEAELNARLVKDGMSLERLRAAHRDNFVAHQYLQSKVTADVAVSRREMVEYYREHIGDYTDPPRVKWQHLAVTAAADHLQWQTSRCPCGACGQARRFHAKLESGADFDELARKYSDGPRKEQGGRWDWTDQGSLADPVLDSALFALPPGHVSPVLEGSDALHILRVLEKDPGGVRPFREVQQEIRATLRSRKLQNAADNYLTTLYAKTDVEYMFPDLQLSRRTAGSPR